MTDRVVILKLVTGEEVIGELNDTLKTSVVKLRHPLIVKTLSTGTIGFLPMCLLSDEEYFEFKNEHVVFTVPSTETISIKYASLIEGYTSPEEVTSDSLVAPSNNTIN